MSALPERSRAYITPVCDSTRWDHFKPRSGDIVVCTAPKCGTTWTQMICAMFVHGSPDLPKAIYAALRLARPVHFTHRRSATATLIYSLPTSARKLFRSLPPLARMQVHTKTRGYGGSRCAMPLGTQVIPCTCGGQRLRRPTFVERLDISQ